jgi:hypothetical protein
MLSDRSLVRVFALYFLWVVLHFAAAHLYAQICVPSTLKGFVLSPFMVSAPHCVGMRWLVQNGASSINAIWIILGMGAIKYIKPVEIK